MLSVEVSQPHTRQSVTRFVGVVLQKPSSFRFIVEPGEENSIDVLRIGADRTDVFYVDDRACQLFTTFPTNQQSFDFVLELQLMVEGNTQSPIFTLCPHDTEDGFSIFLLHPEDEAQIHPNECWIRARHY